MRNNLFNNYRFIQALSLDVVLGAVIFSLFISEVFKIVVPIVVYVELAIAVWCIYTWDHLRDIKDKKDPVSFRHQFHKRFSKQLTILLLFSLLTGAILVFFLPINTVYMGVVISIFVLFYFCIIHFIPTFYHKETLIAVLYGMGIFLGPISCLKGYPENEVFYYLGYSILIAFSNLMIFSEFEKKTDKRDGYPSLAIRLGNKAHLLISTILIFQFVSLVLLFLSSLVAREVFYCFISMITILCIVYFGRKTSLKNEYYRVLGDGIFFIPLFFLV